MVHVLYLLRGVRFVDRGGKHHVHVDHGIHRCVGHCRFDRVSRVEAWSTWGDIDVAAAVAVGHDQCVSDGSTETRNKNGSSLCLRGVGNGLPRCMHGGTIRAHDICMNELS